MERAVSLEISSRDRDPSPLALKFPPSPLPPTLPSLPPLVALPPPRYPTLSLRGDTAWVAFKRAREEEEEGVAREKEEEGEGVGRVVGEKNSPPPTAVFGVPTTTLPLLLLLLLREA